MTSRSSTFRATSHLRSQLSAAAIAGALSLGAAHAANASDRSISEWVSCASHADESAGVAKAFAAAKNHAFTLVVDCPVNLDIGNDIDHTLFIDNGTTVEFTGAGKFTVNNSFIPAFVIADSSNITLTDWNVEYAGGISVTNGTTYRANGQTGQNKPGNAFSDLRLTHWLAANRGIVFDKSEGTVAAQWSGTTNACAVFFLTGDTSNVTVTGLHLYVPAKAGADRFIPVAFTLSANFKARQTVHSNMLLSSAAYANPHNLIFANITLDGTYMGWVGGLKDSVFENIVSLRYGDLQDAAGGHVGGVDKWFAPPHLFYFSNPTDAPTLYNSNVQFKDVQDKGQRVGKARDLGGSDTISGYANSLKLACDHCSVDGYLSLRPDGFMDVLASDDLTITNVTAVYNSSFTNNMYPAWRFPMSGYTHVKFSNITVTDAAASTLHTPIGTIADQSNDDVQMSNVRMIMNHWENANTPFPLVMGSSNTTSMSASMRDDLSYHMRAQTGILEVELHATPTIGRVGQSVQFRWMSRNATSCAGMDGLVGVNGMHGGYSLKLTAAGTQHFTMECRSSSGVTRTSLAVVTKP